MRDKIFAYIKKKYGVSPEYPWARDKDSAVFRHGDNRKWFALVMNVRRDRLGLSEDGAGPASEGNQPSGDGRLSGTGRFAENTCADVINLKIDDMMFKDILLREDGILPAYHMNKEHWITALLDGTVKEERLCGLIDVSFAATASAKKKEKIRPARAVR